MIATEYSMLSDCGGRHLAGSRLWLEQLSMNVHNCGAETWRSLQLRQTTSQMLVTAPKFRPYHTRGFHTIFEWSTGTSRTVAESLITQVVSRLCCKLNCLQLPQKVLAANNIFEISRWTEFEWPNWVRRTLSLCAREGLARDPSWRLETRQACIVWIQRSPAHFRLQRWERQVKPSPSALCVCLSDNYLYANYNYNQ